MPVAPMNDRHRIRPTALCPECDKPRAFNGSGKFRVHLKAGEKTTCPRSGTEVPGWP